jgi:polysaccharide export outer membrane protein
MRIRLVLLAAALLLLSLAGPVPVQAAAAGYRLNPGDMIRISVWKEEELAREAIVQPDGSVSFPLVGQVPAAGRTPAELQAEIVKGIEKYIPDAVVTVELVQAKGNRVYVIGEVNRPGEYQLDRPISIVQAISLAGGFSPFADQDEIRILRTTQGGGETSFVFDYDEIADGKDLSKNITLEPGDTVIVPGGSLF